MLEPARLEITEAFDGHWTAEVTGKAGEPNTDEHGEKTRERERRRATGPPPGRRTTPLRSPHVVEQHERHGGAEDRHQHGRKRMEMQRGADVALEHRHGG